MSPTTLEQRVERLEQIVEGMQSEAGREPGADDWRATVGVFANDPRAREIINEALQLREDERKQSAS
jgi:hypothetical protein